MKSSSSKKKSRPSRGWFRLFFITSLLAGVVFAIVCVVYSMRAWRLDIKQVGQIPQWSLVCDVNGNPYSRLYGENRILVKIDDVSPKFIDALLAREDSRFYHHIGVDPIGLIRAVVRNALGGRLAQGGSTITQQLARNSFELGGRTLDRKLLEAFVAIRIESTFTKRQILENYINRIYYGSGYYGLETASLAYFGKHCKDLTTGEAAMMAGLIRSPNRFSPLRHLEAAKRERDTVLTRMVKLNKITANEAERARKTPIKVVSARSTAVQENYVMDAVDEELRILLDQDQIDDGGMKIYTTINPELQKAAQQSLDDQLTEIEKRSGYPHPRKSEFDPTQGQDTNYLQGSVVVIDNRTGGICALVGGRDYAQSRFNRALLSRRQVGSTIKPFIYATAFSNGIFPYHTVSDGPIENEDVPEAPGWRPGNSDGTNKGFLPARDGLIFSRNTMTVRVGELAGLEKVRKLTATAGIAEVPDFPSSFLGSFEETPRNVTAAYTVFPNQGKRKQAYLIERIDDRLGNPVYRAAHVETSALDPGAAWLTTSAMREVMTRGTAASAKSLGFTKIAGGKTGTTNDYKDAWFVGFTKSLTCGVWVGLDKPAPIIPRGYGATLALPIWIKVMNTASVKQYPAGDFEPGVNLQKVMLCAASNKEATSGCVAAGTSYTMDLPVTLLPKTSCTQHAGNLTDSINPSDTRPALPVRALDSLLNFFRKRK
ncbi:MAG: PBP1A family penicillin-binding protein [Chthoniobacterales bacterium]